MDKLPPGLRRYTKEEALARGAERLARLAKRKPYDRTNRPRTKTRRSISMRPEIYEQAVEIGEGNASLGLERAVRFFRKHTTELALKEFRR